MTIVSRIVMLSAVVALAVPAWADQNPTMPASDPTKAQVRTFEGALRSAVETGTRNFAQRATEMVPELFSVVDAPLVNGVAVHVAGRTDYVFHIQVPTIWPVVQVMALMNRAGNGSGPQRVADGPRLQQELSADSPAVNGSNRPELEREYAVKVRDALVDAILDNSGVLPLKGTDTLVVFASGSDSGIPPSLYESVPRKLILSISGAELASLRQGALTRDEAKTKVVEEHF